MIINTNINNVVLIFKGTSQTTVNCMQLSVTKRHTNCYAKDFVCRGRNASAMLMTMCSANRHIFYILLVSSVR